MDGRGPSTDLVAAACAFCEVDTPTELLGYGSCHRCPDMPVMPVSRLYYLQGSNMGVPLLESSAHWLSVGPHSRQHCVVHVPSCSLAQLAAVPYLLQRSQVYMGGNTGAPGGRTRSPGGRALRRWRPRCCAARRRGTPSRSASSPPRPTRPCPPSWPPPPPRASGGSASGSCCPVRSFKGFCRVKGSEDDRLQGTARGLLLASAVCHALPD